MKIDGVEYKFKQGVNGNTDANRRFVGYIAQQIESVVPHAVQLIDGILHVDYESLIPYLSEAIKQNFKDINQLNSKIDQIHEVIDVLYADFMKKENRQSSSTAKFSVNNSQKYSRFDGLHVKYLSQKNPWRWIICMSILVILVIGIGVGLIFAWPSINLQPASPSPSVPTVTPPLTAGQLRDLAALEEFYYKMDGERWRFSSNWLSNTTSVCEWYGISCNSDGRVTGLMFTGNCLGGSIPSSIAMLDQLQVLALDLNALDGSIPDSITTLHHLEHLSFTGAGLTGDVPPGIFSLPALKGIFLEGNKFTAWELPLTIKNAKNLTYIMLGDCNIIGTIPEVIGLLSNLTWLSMSNNRLHGTVPSFANTVMEDINLGDNNLEGCIPALPSTLISLVLRMNNFTGNIQALANLPRLNQLDLSMNSFDGIFSLSDQVLQSIHNLDISANLFNSASIVGVPKNLSYCDASMNDFVCPIPQWLKKCNGACE